MATVGEHLESIRKVLKQGKSPEPGSAALLEAATGEEVLLRKASGAPMPWSTKRVNLQEAKEAVERARIERLTALQDLVKDESEVFEIENRWNNSSPNICIGRARRNDIVLADETISSQHASIELGTNGQHYLVDGGSSNGTFVNKTQLAPSSSVVMQSGDCIRFGQRVFYYLPAIRLVKFFEIRLVRNPPAG